MPENGETSVPELTGIGKYTGEMAGWLAARGHDVRIATAPPYYPQWQVGAGYSAWCYQKDQINGAKQEKTLFFPTGLIYK